jgi:phosphatidylserine/phosphatidylglycerophosphate/cardiolipin synthase-like enzyme
VDLKLSDLSLNALKPFVTGDDSPSPYMSGQDLIKFFNAFGFDDEYLHQDGGLPNAWSRNQYALERLKELNGKYEFNSLVEALADSRKVSDPNDIAGKINEIIKHDGYNLEKNQSEIYKVSGKELDDPIAIEAHFQEIKSQILECIRNARFTIWVAVAWFTDSEIGNELRKKHRSGVNVRVIVNDDKTTEQHGLKFDNKGIEYLKVSPDSPWGKKLMHNKFCIIDLCKVIHGSYNWTSNAQYNNESITITESRDIAEDFATQFIELKDQKDT